MFPRILLLISILIIISAHDSVSALRPSIDIKIPDSTEAQILTLEDGSKLVGQATFVSDTVVTFQSNLGSTDVPVARIKKVEVVPRSSFKGGTYWPPNPNDTRLYFGPTARTLKKGQAYFSDYYIFFAGLSYGLTDNITVGGGLSLIPGVSLNDQAFFFTPKIGLATSKNTSLGLGALILKIPGKIDDEDIPAFGAFYGVGTLGGPDASISASLGYGFAGKDVGSKPVVIIGGEKRLTRRISFVTENWVLPGVDNPIVSYGARFFGESMGFDLGFFTPTGEDFIFPGIPWVAFTFNFK